MPFYPVIHFAGLAQHLMLALVKLKVKAGASVHQRPSHQLRVVSISALDEESVVRPVAILLSHTPSLIKF